MFGGLPLQLFEPIILLAIIFVLLRFFLGAFGSGAAGVAVWFVYQVIAVPIRVAVWTLRKLWDLWWDRHTVGHAIAGRRPRRHRLARMAERSANTNRRPPEVLYGDNGETVVLDDSDGPIGPHDWEPGWAPPDYPPDEFEQVWQAHLRRLERRKRWAWLFAWMRRHDNGSSGQDGSLPSCWELRWTCPPLPMPRQSRPIGYGLPSASRKPKSA